MLPMLVAVMVCQTTIMCNTKAKHICARGTQAILCGLLFVTTQTKKPVFHRTLVSLQVSIHVMLSNKLNHQPILIIQVHSSNIYSWIPAVISLSGFNHGHCYMRQSSDVGSVFSGSLPLKDKGTKKMLFRTRAVNGCAENSAGFNHFKSSDTPSKLHC